MHPTTNAHKLDPTVPCSILTSRVAGKKALDRVNCLVFCGAPFMSSSWTSAEEQQQQFRAAASATGRGTAKQWLLVARPEFRSEIGNYVTNLCLVFNMKVPSLPPLHFFHPFIHPLLTHPHIVGIATDRPHSSLPSAVVMQFAGVRDKAHDECTIS